MSIQEIMVTQDDALVASTRQPQEHVEPLDAFVDALRQRELLDPLLLLSAGYVAVPFLLQQVRLLLAPLLALMGLSKEEGPRV